jgi:hypothetical protein
MKLFMKLFHKKGADKNEEKAKGGKAHKDNDASSLTTSGNTSGSYESTKSTKRNPAKKNILKSSKSQRSIPESMVESQTANERLVATFIEMNNRGCPTYEEFLSFYASDKVTIKFEDVPNITSGVMGSEMMKLHQSFPDFRFSYDCIKETKPGKVVVEEMVVSGTHMGAPYAFSWYPPVPTSNKHCVNDPERMWFTVKDGKIVMQEIISLGDISGCAGFYLQVGGSMDMPPPAAPLVNED